MRRPVLVAVAVAVVAMAWVNALGASFQFDDWEVIVRDPRVQDLAAWWDGMPGIRPLLKLSYALNHASGLGVVGFHAVNLLIHAANGLLLLWLLRRLARQAGLPEDDAARVAGVATLLFLLHPVQTEAVTYASGRSASLSATFVLASLAAWLRGREGGSAHAWQGLSLLLMLAALGVKESAVAVPAAMVLWMAVDTRDRPSWPVIARATGAHWLVLLLAMGAMIALPAYRHLLAVSLGTRSVAENLVAQSQGIAWLAGQLLRIGALNADPALAAAATPGASGWLTILALAGAAAVALLWRHRFPLAAFACGWTIAWLAPTNSLLARLDLVNERQWYLALAGPALLAALGLARLRIATPPVAATLLALLVVLLGGATFARNAAYRDEVVFWRDVAARSPHNARAWNNLGVAFAARCELGSAGRAWQRALALDRGYVRAAVNLRLLREGVLPAGLGPCPRG